MNRKHMAADEKAQAEQLKQHEEVQAALRQTSTGGGVEPVAAKPVDKFWFVAYALLIAGLLGAYYLADVSALPLPARYTSLMQRVATGGVLVILVLAAARAVDIYVSRQIVSTASRYNLNRVVTLLVIVSIAVIGLTVLFQTWYSVALSLGLLSLTLSFSLQTPMTSFIGWIFLLVRHSYRVGDRIKIGDAKGDVIDVSYIDTTLWEFGGPYLSTEHPSGRIIKFPNSFVLSQPVYNYSWPLFPYIWNEIKFNIAYDSDLKFVAETMQRVVEEDLGEYMLKRVPVYRELLAKTPVDELQIHERPVVHFRAGDNTWLEAIVRYLVHPKESGSVKTRLIVKLLAELNAKPESVQFPRSNMR